jgi:glycosyltransferase involved in cell wall biosynthesis
MKNLGLPTVSIIMPIRNEAAYIERSLESVLMQDYAPDLLEILVADGNSNDDTKDKIARLCKRFPKHQVRVIDNPHQYMPLGFNLGLKYVRGEIIIMMGGHAEIAQDYISQCVKLLNEYPVVCVGGTIDTIADGWVSKTIAIAMSSLFGVGDVAFRTRPDRTMEVDTAVYAAYKSHVFSEIGCLDEEMIRNQDDEFNYRLREQGGKILFSPQIHSRYYSRSGFLSLWKQYYQYGFYKVRVLQKHPRQMRPRQFVPPAFVLSLIVSAIFALSFIFHSSSLILQLSSFVPITYLIANFFASLYTASTHGWKYLPFLPLTFAILHLSYGFGFLSWPREILNRWGDKIGKTPVWSSEIADDIARLRNEYETRKHVLRRAMFIRYSIGQIYSSANNARGRF